VYSLDAVMIFHGGILFLYDKNSGKVNTC